MPKVWSEFSVHLVSCFILFLCWSLFFFNYAETTYFLAINSYSPPVPSFCSLLLLHVKLLSSGISRMVGLELRVYEHTVWGVVPMATSFLWLYVNSVLSLSDCNFIPVLVLFAGAIQSLFWLVLKLFLIKFESILYYYKNCGHGGESAFGTCHSQSFPISCAFFMLSGQMSIKNLPEQLTWHMARHRQRLRFKTTKSTHITGIYE